MNALVLFYRVPPILLVAVSFGFGGKLDGKVILLARQHERHGRR